MPFQGRIDVVTSSGFIEGWAISSETDIRPVSVSITAGLEIAYGLANLYRKDLALAGLGFGWCFFRLKLGIDPQSVLSKQLVLRERVSSTIIDRTDDVRFVNDDNCQVASLDQILSFDPLILPDIESLRFCEPILGAYIRQHGIRQFVRTTYLYVLGRPADANGVTNYGRLIRRGVVMPFGLIKVLSESEEFQRSNRVLAAPTSPDFAYTSS